MKTNGLDSFESLKMLCKAIKKYGLYINWDGTKDFKEIEQAVPFLRFEDWIEDKNIFLFDTKEDAEHHYYSVVGDDGPTKYNSYHGDIRVYAVLIDNNGKILNENT